MPRKRVLGLTVALAGTFVLYWGVGGACGWRPDNLQLINAAARGDNVGERMPKKIVIRSVAGWFRVAAGYVGNRKMLSELCGSSASRPLGFGLPQVGIGRARHGSKPHPRETPRKTQRPWISAIRGSSA